MAFKDRFNGGYADRNNYRNYDDNYRPYKQEFQDRRQFKKHTAAGHKEGKTKAGRDYKITWGWNVSKGGGLVSYLAKNYAKSHMVESKNGRKWLTVIVVATLARTKDTKIKPGLMDLQTGKVIVKDWKLVINPKAPNGGYCGTFMQSRNRR